jgi:hypothetical protein
MLNLESGRSRESADIAVDTAATAGGTGADDALRAAATSDSVADR